MAAPMMPKATAVWLIENTSLSFQQVAEFCGLHPLEVQGIADGEVAKGIQGLDPTLNNQLTKEEIERCEADPTARLNMKKVDLPQPVKRTKGPRYTPVAKRQDKPDGVAYLLRHFPELKDAQISKLIGTTKATILAIRERTHWNSPNIRPRDPVLLGLCSQTELNAAV
ncbi:MAG TPA: cell cycle transcriptional regulator TrcR, partial [Kiloniellales bacterium]|nr:cell cycle transcriptional regulator TrcR [Kiloniellales bacterium]